MRFYLAGLAASNQEARDSKKTKTRLPYLCLNVTPVHSGFGWILHFVLIVSTC